MLLTHSRRFVVKWTSPKPAFSLTGFSMCLSMTSASYRNHRWKSFLLIPSLCSQTPCSWPSRTSNLVFVIGIDNTFFKMRFYLLSKCLQRSPSARIQQFPWQSFCSQFNASKCIAHNNTTSKKHLSWKLTSSRLPFYRLFQELASSSTRAVHLPCNPPGTLYDDFSFFWWGG